MEMVGDEDISDSGEEGVEGVEDDDEMYEERVGIEPEEMVETFMAISCKSKLPTLLRKALEYKFI